MDKEKRPVDKCVLRRKAAGDTESGAAREYAAGTGKTPDRGVREEVTRMRKVVCTRESCTRVVCTAVSHARGTVCR
ncbi:hypothetical protein SAMN05216251_10695 [Actinacidiphila alni]|uniref:Uncharacterized protein n=1 Tax=Actinacidiphila alni TaxID=380248 RepID=A0A1I2E9U5_9ACTN|nr:hypothetical protein SAMN05216251_10695 [Actinacidiphila alni]